MRSFRFLLALILTLLVVWAVLPVARAVALAETFPFQATPQPPTGLHTVDAEFPATDGTLLRGWLLPARPSAPTIILVPGFKADRSTMLPYARFLHAAGYNLLLYDSRGTGASNGQFSLGLHEVDDVSGAVNYLQRLPDYPNHRYAVLGVSLGAGVAIVAAARTPAILGVIADSPYTNQSAEVNRLDTFHLLGMPIPLAPFGPRVVDFLIGGTLSSFSPLRAIPHIAPRPVLLIHARDDTNPTTPLSAAEALKRAGGPTTTLWIAPRGGHAGALAAQPALYQARVKSFLRSVFTPVM